MQIGMGEMSFMKDGLFQKLWDGKFKNLIEQFKGAIPGNQNASMNQSSQTVGSLNSNTMHENMSQANDYDGRKRYVSKYESAVNEAKASIQDSPDAVQDSYAQQMNYSIQQAQVPSKYSQYESVQQSQFQNTANNVVPFMPNQDIYCTHVWAVTSFEHCTKIIENLKQKHAFYITMELIKDDPKTIEDCVNYLSGAAAALGVKLHPLSTSIVPIYLIESSLIRYDIDANLMQYIECLRHTEMQNKPMGYHSNMSQAYSQQQPQIQYAQTAPAPRPQPYRVSVGSNQQNMYQRPPVSVADDGTQASRTMNYSGRDPIEGSTSAFNQPANLAQIVNGNPLQK